MLYEVITDKQDVYKELVLLLLDMGRVEEAFNYAEKAKSVITSYNIHYTKLYDGEKGVGRKIAGEGKVGASGR